eukprot:5304979-Prymnesium_polylepis.3
MQKHTRLGMVVGGRCGGPVGRRRSSAGSNVGDHSRGSPGDARQEDESRQRSVLTSSSAHGGRNGDSGTLVSEATDARSGRVPSAWGEIGTAPSARSAELTSAGQACLKATATRGERAPQKLAAAFRVSRASCAFRSNHALLPSPCSGEAHCHAELHNGGTAVRVPPPYKRERRLRLHPPEPTGRNHVD